MTCVWHADGDEFGDCDYGHDFACRSTVLEMFGVRWPDAECRSYFRVCSEGEEAADAVLVFCHVAVGLLVVSCGLSVLFNCLADYRNYYR